VLGNGGHGAGVRLRSRSPRDAASWARRMGMLSDGSHDDGERSGARASGRPVPHRAAGINMDDL
jgi:hypothetical protein